MTEVIVTLLLCVTAFICVDRVCGLLETWKDAELDAIENYNNNNSQPDAEDENVHARDDGEDD